MTEEEYTALVDRCRQELRQKIEATVHRWKLTTFTRCDLDQTTGRLAFSDGAIPKVVCTVQVVGTFSGSSKTWLWAWDSPWVVDELKRDALVAQEFGRKHGLARLTTRKWAASEQDGWDMTALTAHLASAEGAYRLPNRDVMIFMILKSIEASPGAEE